MCTKIITVWTRTLRECKPLPMPKILSKSDLGLKSVFFQINHDLELHVCWTCPKMLWMHYLVGVGHFAKFGTNWPLIVWEMLTNVQKSPIPQCWRKYKKSDPESTQGSGSPRKLNQFSRVTPCPCLPSLVNLCFCICQLPCLQNDRMNDRQNDNIFHLVGGGNNCNDKDMFVMVLWSWQPS